MPNTNKQFREQLFKNILNFPENPTEDEIISRNIGGNAFFTMPGGTGRAMVIPGTGDRELTRQGLMRADEEQRQTARGSIVIEEGRKKLENQKSELSRMQNEHDSLLKRGYSEQNLFRYKEGIEKLRKDITDKESWYVGYDELQKKIQGYEAKGALKEEREFEIKKKQAEGDYGKTREGMITQGQIDIQKEMAKTGRVSNEKLLELANKSYDDAYAKAVTDTDKEELGSRDTYIQDYIKSNQGAFPADQEAPAGEITGIIDGKRTVIKSNTEAEVEGEPFSILPNGDLIPKTVKGLMVRLPMRSDLGEIKKAIIREVGGENKPLTYEPIRNLYARAVSNNDTELSSLFLEIMPYISQITEEEKLIWPEDILQEQYNPAEIDKTMKEKGLSKQKAINTIANRIRAEGKQSKSTEQERAKETKTKLTEISKLTKNPKFGKDSYGNVLSLHLDDGHYLDSREVQDALRGDFDSWLNKVKNEYNITSEEEKLIKNWASALMWPNQRNF